MPQDPVGIWAECRWNGLSKDTGFTRSSLCASNETDFSNNISKAGESEAAMQTLSNYCCGPVIALPKSCFNNMKCWTAHAYREEGKNIIKSIGAFFLVKRALIPRGMGWGVVEVMMGIKTDLMSTQSMSALWSLEAWGELFGYGILCWLLKKEQAVFCLPWSEISPLKQDSHTPIISDS